MPSLFPDDAKSIIEALLFVASEPFCQNYCRNY